MYPTDIHILVHVWQMASPNMSTSHAQCGGPSNFPKDVHIVICRACEYVSLDG